MRKHKIWDAHIFFLLSALCIPATRVSISRIVLIFNLLLVNIPYQKQTNLNELLYGGFYVSFTSSGV